MDCQEVRGMLSEYMDEQLDNTRQHQVHAHLEKCSQCRAELAELQRTVNFLQAMPAAVPPPEFRAQLRERVRQDHKNSTRTGLLQKLAGNRRLQAAAAFLAVFLLGSSLLWYGWQGQSQNSNLAKNYGVMENGQEAGQARSTGEDSASGDKTEADKEMRVQSAPPGTGASEPGISSQEEKSGTAAGEDKMYIMSENEASDYFTYRLELAVSEDNLEQVKKRVLDTAVEFGGLIQNTGETSVVILYPGEQYAGALDKICSMGDVLKRDNEPQDGTKHKYVEVTVNLVPGQQ